MEVDLGAPTEISRALIDESSYPQVSKFSIEAQMPDGNWKSLVQGGAIGPVLIVSFPSVKAQKFRLQIHEAKLTNPAAGVTVNEFQLFER